jgi:hypothetical protein
MMETDNISATKIEHTGFDEFRQYVHQNALGAG